MNADEIIRHLGLVPHPEGGYYREIHRDSPEDGGRGAVTSIYFLLRAGERSRWHRVDATEIFSFHQGDPLAMSLSPDGNTVTTAALGPNLAEGEQPQIVVPAGWWQSAECLGAWSLVGCIVAPAFRFEGFEMAPPDWEPGR